MATDFSARMTYTGSFKFGSTQYAARQVTSVAERRPLFYDHIRGLQDEFSGGDKQKAAAETTGGGQNINQKRIWRYSPQLPKVTVSGYVGEDGIGGIVEAAVKGTSSTVTTTYYAKSGVLWTLTGAVVSTLRLSIAAGDVMTFDAEFIGKSYSTSTEDASALDCTKLMTWDRCFVKLSGSGLDIDDLASFELTINNHVSPIYTAGSSFPNPHDIRFGIQEVTGTISSYGSFGDLTSVTDATLEFGNSAESYTLSGLAFEGTSDVANAGPFISSVGFTAVKDGAIWDLS